MAEQPQNGQSKGIGELFVEFGTKGVPSLLKNLNSVSASFLLGKNAANQFVQSLSKPIKEAGRGAVAIGKLAASFGTTLEEAARLKLFFKNYNLSEGLIGDLVNISDMLTKVRLGIGGISGEFAYAMHRMGLNWQDYDGSIESMIQMRNDVEKALAQGNFSEPEKRIMRQNAGLTNPEWAYAAEKGELNLDNYKSISEDTIQNLIKTEEAMAKAAASVDQLKMHLVEKLTPAVVTIADFISKHADKGAVGDYDNAGKTAGNIMKYGMGLGLGPAAGVLLGDIIKQDIQEKLEAGKTSANGTPNKKEGASTGGASMIDNTSKYEESIPNSVSQPNPQGYLGTLPDLAPPPALSSNSTSISPTININNTNNITGDNAQEIANKINEINMQNIEYAQYQVSNLGAK